MLVLYLLRVPSVRGVHEANKTARFRAVGFVLCFFGFMALEFAGASVIAPAWLRLRAPCYSTHRNPSQCFQHPCTAQLQTPLRGLSLQTDPSFTGTIWGVSLL